ncbi:MAG TPA: metallophosphoesterase [Candidatus Nanoarchaeia archaeon]|nr:metallophosphoesterase [Candidatus Nanoarchaeia archaeon]
MDQSAIIEQLIRAGQLPTPDKIRSMLQQEMVSVPIKKHSVENGETSVQILTNETYSPQKIEVKDFVNYFRGRHNYFKNVLINRPELSNATSIARLSGNTKTSIIAAIVDIKRLSTGTMKLQLEDLSGRISAIISAKNPEALAKAQSLCLDEVVAFKGSSGKSIFFVDDITWPDIPPKQRARTPDEVYMACLSDVHVGSRMFLPKTLNKFLKWLNGNYGNARQRAIADKTKYIVVCGDIVDGVGIYPSQEKELKITDIYKQYDVTAKLFSKISDDKQVIMIPGNHDAMRIEEHQPRLYKDLATPLYELPNVHMAPNPANVIIHKKDNFPGVHLLMYHGYSFDYFVENIASLREAGGYDAADKLWEFLLKRRHLAPTYGATLALPMNEDPLLIREVPDIAISGHIHKSKIGSYKGVQTISCSCFQDTTSFQQRMGHHPNPGVVPLVNLQTGKAWSLRFK